jgi:hypothetical protein
MESLCDNKADFLKLNGRNKTFRTLDYFLFGPQQRIKSKMLLFKIKTILIGDYVHGNT